MDERSSDGSVASSADDGQECGCINNDSVQGHRTIHYRPLLGCGGFVAALCAPISLMIANTSGASFQVAAGLEDVCDA